MVLLQLLPTEELPTWGAPSLRSYGGGLRIDVSVCWEAQLCSPTNLKATSFVTKSSTIPNRSHLNQKHEVH
eukprot:1844689-Amphidinium_carterae.1